MSEHLNNLRKIAIKRLNELFDIYQNTKKPTEILYIPLIQNDVYKVLGNDVIYNGIKFENEPEMVKIIDLLNEIEWE
jgi:hypothetical protein